MQVLARLLVVLYGRLPRSLERLEPLVALAARLQLDLGHSAKPQCRHTALGRHARSLHARAEGKEEEEEEEEEGGEEEGEEEEEEE